MKTVNACTELWTDWINDETASACSAADLEKITELYRRAFEDYACKIPCFPTLRECRVPSRFSLCLSCWQYLILLFVKASHCSCSALPLYVRFLRYLRQRYLEGDESVSPAVIRQSFEEALAAVGLHIPLGTSFSRRSVCYEYSPFFC